MYLKMWHSVFVVYSMMCLCVLVFTFIFFNLLMVGLVVCIMYVLPIWRNKYIYNCLFGS